MGNREQRRIELAHKPIDDGLYGATRFFLAKMPNGKQVISTDRMMLDDKVVELLDHEIGKYALIN